MAYFNHCWASPARARVEFPFRIIKRLWGTPACATAASQKTPGCICSSPSPTSIRPAVSCSPPPKPSETSQMLSKKPLLATDIMPKATGRTFSLLEIICSQVPPGNRAEFCRSS
jgi:hypothetical protein